MTLLSFDELITIASALLAAAERFMAEGRPDLADKPCKQAFCVLGAIQIYGEAGHDLFDSEKEAFDAAFERFQALMPRVVRQ